MLKHALSIIIQKIIISFSIKWLNMFMYGYGRHIVLD